jgi:glutathione S-transferase
VRLITIPVSHYCERARWALDYCGIDYVEEQHLQMIHARHAKQAGGRHTCPVLVTKDSALDDSRDIVEFADANASADRRLYPEGDSRADVETIERSLEGEFGVESRRLAYHYFLQVGGLFHKYNGASAPRWEKAALRVSFPFLKKRVMRYLRVNPATVAAAEDIVAGHLDRVAEMLADGREYLAGDRFTAADLTFAALCAPLVVPAQYGIPLPSLDEIPKRLRPAFEGYRRHPAGKHALRVYQRHRR